MYQWQCQQFRGELRVSRLVRDLGVGALPEAVAVAVHLQMWTWWMRRSEPNTSVLRAPLSY